MHPLRAPSAAIVLPLVACFAAGSLYGWSGLSQAVRATFGVGHAEVGQVFSIAIVAFTLGVLLAAAVGRSIGPSLGLAMSALAGAGCLAAAAAVAQFYLVVLFYGVGFGFCAGLVYALALSLTVQSGPRMTALAVASFGLGGILFGYLFRSSANNAFGLSSLLPAAALLGLAGLAGLALPPRHLPIRPTRQPAFDATVRRSQPVILWAVFFGGSAAGLMVLGQSSAMIEDLGADTALSSVVVAAVATGNTCGRLLVAAVPSSVRPARILQSALVAVCVGLAILVGTSTSAIALAGATFVAVGYGLIAATVPIMTREISGDAAFNRVFGLVFTAWGAAGLLAPWVAGAMRDATGSFVLPVQMALATAVAALVAACLLRTGPRVG